MPGKAQEQLPGAPKKPATPVRQTLTLARLLMKGHSHHDALEALQHVRGNNVEQAHAWILDQQEMK